MASNAAGANNLSGIPPPPAPPYFLPLNQQNFLAPSPPNTIQYRFGLLGAGVPAGPYGYADGRGSTSAYQRPLFQHTYSLPHGSNNSEISFLLQANSTLLAKLHPDLQEVKKDIAVVKELYMNSPQSAIQTVELKGIKTLIESLSREFYTFKDAYKEKEKSSKKNSANVSKRRRSPARDREHSCTRNYDQSSSRKSTKPYKSYRNDIDSYNERSKSPPRVGHEERYRPSRQSRIPRSDPKRITNSSSHNKISSYAKRPSKKKWNKAEATLLSSHLKIIQNINKIEKLKIYGPQAKLDRCGKSTSATNLLSDRLRITPFHQTQTNSHQCIERSLTSVATSNRSQMFSSCANARSKRTEHVAHQNIYGPSCLSVQHKVSESMMSESPNKNRSTRCSPSIDAGHGKYNPSISSGTETKCLTFNQYNEWGKSTAHKLSLPVDIPSNQPKSPYHGQKLANSSSHIHQNLQYLEEANSNDCSIKVESVIEPEDQLFSSESQYNQRQNSYGMAQNRNLNPPPPPSQNPITSENLSSAYAPSSHFQNLLLQLPSKSNKSMGARKSVVSMKENDVFNSNWADDGVMSPDNDKITRPLQQLITEPLTWAERAEKVIVLFQSHELFTVVSPLKYLELSCTVLLRCLDTLRESVEEESTTTSQDFLVKGNGLISSASFDKEAVDEQDATIVEHILDIAKPLIRLFFGCLCLEFLPLDDWEDTKSLADFIVYTNFSSSELDIEMFGTMESHDIFLEIASEYPDGPSMEIRVRQKLRKVRELVARALPLPGPKDTGNDFYTAMRKHLIILRMRHRTTSINQGVSANSLITLQTEVHKTHEDALDAMRHAVAFTVNDEKKIQEISLCWKYILEELIAQYYSIKIMEGISVQHIQGVAHSISMNPEHYTNERQRQHSNCCNDMMGDIEDGEVRDISS